jgi:hypothetical protein
MIDKPSCASTASPIIACWWLGAYPWGAHLGQCAGLGMRRERSQRASLFRRQGSPIEALKTGAPLHAPGSSGLGGSP